MQKQIRDKGGKEQKIIMQKEREKDKWESEIGELSAEMCGKVRGVLQ